MRCLLSSILALAALASNAVAQTVPPFPAGALETEARLMTRVGPQTRDWIRQEATRELAAGAVSREAAKKAAASYRSFGGLGDGDIEALAFLVMTAAAKSAQEDLKTIMGHVKQINEPEMTRKMSRSGRPDFPMALLSRPMPCEEVDADYACASRIAVDRALRHCVSETVVSHRLLRLPRSACSRC